MKKINHINLFISSLFILVLAACSGKKTEVVRNDNPLTLPAKEVSKPVIVGNETALLLKDLKDNGDYVNSKNFPSLIKASIVKESLEKNILVLDLRSPKQFSDGHIKGAVSKKFEDLPAYFETGIKPFEFDKIILVSDDGQISSYAACLLRLMGYGNVFSMRWGMSAWNNKFANEAWLKDVSGKFESDLETKVNETPIATSMPDLNTGQSTGEGIGKARFEKLFKDGTGNIILTSDEVFSNPQKYFIINLERKDKYESGHIPGAYRYKHEGTLGFPDEMGSIPVDKTVVVYCGTGHNSAFATAYLKLFGYDARTLKYGNNGFMYNKMLKDKAALSWLPFTKADVNDFETVKK